MQMDKIKKNGIKRDTLRKLATLRNSLLLITVSQQIEKKNKPNLQM